MELYGCVGRSLISVSKSLKAMTLIKKPPNVPNTNNKAQEAPGAAAGVCLPFCTPMAATPPPSAIPSSRASVSESLSSESPLHVAVALSLPPDECTLTALTLAVVLAVLQWAQSNRISHVSIWDSKGVLKDHTADIKLHAANSLLVPAFGFHSHDFDNCVLCSPLDDPLQQAYPSPPGSPVASPVLPPLDLTLWNPLHVLFLSAVDGHDRIIQVTKRLAVMPLLPVKAITMDYLSGVLMKGA